MKRCDDAMPLASSMNGRESLERSATIVQWLLTHEFERDLSGK